MPRAKVYPRLDGFLLLIRGPSLKDLELTYLEGADEKHVKEVYKRVRELVMNTKDFYQIRTKRELIIIDQPEGWAWCVYDALPNVMDYKWLKEKAKELMAGIIHLVNKELRDAHGYKGSSSKREPVTAQAP